ncbi:Protein SKIP34 [Camellia lanceoleosa]|uniref:Protein SKIP34 n=1 Tax=Camellia lanceoleosa TaxID=1840588 RepID=A0ACC0IX08_9ERIC|nr:Protein SKIP34 [Camellia lanceoleosa]
MCCGQQRLVSKDDITTSWTRPPPTDAAVVEDLRLRLADTEARLERARAREADLSRRLDEMKRFVSVMEILETYLKRRFLRQQHDVARLFSPLPPN